MGIFKTDPNKNVLGRAWQIIYRFWNEFPARAGLQSRCFCFMGKNGLQVCAGGEDISNEILIQAMEILLMDIINICLMMIQQIRLC